MSDPLLLLVGYAAYTALILGSIVVWKKYRTRHPKRLPFTQDFRNGPGKSLGEQLDTASQSLGESLVTLFHVPVTAGFIYLLLETQETPYPSATAGLIGGTIFVIAFRSLFRAGGNIHKYRLGLQGEVYVAQCLMPLIAKGYRIFHDYPAKGFNFDHVVIGPEGIFAVETKARSKPDRKGGSADATVRVEGEKLVFPDYVDTDSIPQAKRQARWLQDQLKRQFGDTVPVIPVLVIPGWFVESSWQAGLLISSGKGIDKQLADRGAEPLTTARIKRDVDHCIQKCRYDPLKVTRKRAMST